VTLAGQHRTQKIGDPTLIVCGLNASSIMTTVETNLTDNASAFVTPIARVMATGRNAMRFVAKPAPARVGRRQCSISG
jgi:hypothetical protein